MLPEEAGTEDGARALYCPGPLRDDVALGEAVNEELVAWAEQVGIYPGQLDRVRAANFGRLMMLTHPATDDPVRLLAAARCVLAEWSTDDHFLDDESLGADAATIGARMGVAYAAIDPSHLPVSYAPQLDRALSDEPVAVAYRSAFDHLAQYASATQLARLRHELAVMFMAYNQEAAWRMTGHTPAVWEYLTHRSENSFLPPMVLVDSIAGYEVPAFEFADGRVRRVFAIAGLASVILNDLYSMGSESDTDFDLPKVLIHEEHCSPQEAVERSVDIHSELMHTFVVEARDTDGRPHDRLPPRRPSVRGMKCLRTVLLSVTAVLGACGNDEKPTGAIEPTVSRPPPDTTGATATTRPAGTEMLPGERVEIFPYEGARLAVVGVAAGDKLNVRSGPGVAFDRVFDLEPLATNATAVGHNRSLGEMGFWSQIIVDGKTGWANNAFLLQPGQVTDITAAIFPDPANRPRATSMVELARIVSRLRDSEDPPSRVVVVDGPVVGDVGEITVDVIGLGDDAGGGERLKIFAEPASGGRSFTVRSVEATELCIRGVSDAGLCL